jgi:hypothetical protein
MGSDLSSNLRMIDAKNLLLRLQKGTLPLSHATDDLFKRVVNVFPMMILPISCSSAAV